MESLGVGQGFEKPSRLRLQREDRKKTDRDHKERKE